MKNISFETAKLAKEKGYKKLSGPWYDSFGIFHKEIIGEPHIIFDTEYSAPYQGELYKWLVENDIYVYIFPDITVYDKRTWIVDIYKYDKYVNQVEYVKNSYEEAFELGLQKALNLL